MMRTYLRRGDGRVVWLTLPAPKGDGSTRSSRPSTARSCGRATRCRARPILRADLIFTPDGFRETMRYRGVDVRVREPDGVHLNVAGTAIAAKAIARARSCDSRPPRARAERGTLRVAAAVSGRRRRGANPAIATAVAGRRSENVQRRRP